MRAAPLWFGNPDRPLFGWHHPADIATRRNAAVVLCPPLNFEYSCAYRAWRLLAERLAAAGFDVLRFDYAGTGNSAGDPEDPEQLAGWLESIRLAAREVRSRSGTVRLALVGCRLGGTLAAVAAATIPNLDDLVLWDPFRTGKAWVRETRALAKLAGDAENTGADFHAAGFLVTGATAQALESIDLISVAPPRAARALLIERDERPLDRKLAEHLQRRIEDLTLTRMPGTSDCLVEPMTSRVPEQILDRIVSWLVHGHPETGLRSSIAPPPAGAEPASNSLGERAFFFGPGQRLFGILTEPVEPHVDLPAVLVLNTGCEHHIGPHRMHVPLSRRWSSKGAFVMRYDLGGMGDSRPPDGAPENVAYPPHALEDLRIAVAELQARSGQERVVLLGICAGGWHAFDAARSGLAVDAVLAGNAPLYLREGPNWSRDGLRERRELRRYARSLALGDKWAKVLAGGVNLRAVARIAVTGLWQSVQRGAVRLADRGRRSGLAGDLLGIAERGIPMLFVYSQRDLSYSYFELHAGTSIKRAKGKIEVAVVPDADHTFRSCAAQDELGRLLDRFLELRRTPKPSGRYRSIKALMTRSPALPSQPSGRPGR